MDTYNIRECFLCYFVFALILTVKLTVFLIRHTKNAFDVSPMQLKPLIQVTFYIHIWFIYRPTFRFQVWLFPTHLCYNFSCIEGCLESLWRGSDIYNWINEVVLTAPLLFIPYFAIWSTALFVKKFPFSRIFVGIPSRPGASNATPTRARKKVVLLKFSFRSLLKSNMDQHAVGTGKPSVFNSPLRVFIHVYNV